LGLLGLVAGVPGDEGKKFLASRQLEVETSCQELAIEALDAIRRRRNGCNMHSEFANRKLPLTDSTCECDRDPLVLLGAEDFLGPSNERPPGLALQRPIVSRLRRRSGCI
jgi:hypothetical protein